MTWFILIATTIISIMAFYNPELFGKLLFNAYQIKYRKESWRFFSYALIHSGWLHLLINMWVLWSFGTMVEAEYKMNLGTKGVVYYLLLYVGGVLFSVLYDFGKQKENYHYNAVGASGAVSAVVFASILIYPAGRIFLFPIPFPIPSWLFGILYLIYSAYMSKQGNDQIGHNAHFWGALFGLVFTALIIPGSITSFFNQLF